MGLDTLPYLEDHACLVAHTNTIYKLKINYADEMNTDIRKSLSTSFTQISAHKQLEQVLRAVLYRLERRGQIGPIQTLNFIVRPSTEAWRLADKIEFSVDGKSLQCYPDCLLFKVYIKKRSELKKSSCDQNTSSRQNTSVDNATNSKARKSFSQTDLKICRKKSQKESTQNSNDLFTPVLGKSTNMFCTESVMKRPTLLGLLRQNGTADGDDSPQSKSVIIGSVISSSMLRFQNKNAKSIFAEDVSSKNGHEEKLKTLKTSSSSVHVADNATTSASHSKEIRSSNNVEDVNIIASTNIRRYRHQMAKTNKKHTNHNNNKSEETDVSMRNRDNICLVLKDSDTVEVNTNGSIVCPSGDLQHTGSIVGKDAQSLSTAAPHEMKRPDNASHTPKNKHKTVASPRKQLYPVQTGHADFVDFNEKNTNRIQPNRRSPRKTNIHQLVFDNKVKRIKSGTETEENTRQHNVMQCDDIAAKYSALLSNPDKELDNCKEKDVVTGSSLGKFQDSEKKLASTQDSANKTKRYHHRMVPSSSSSEDSDSSSSSKPLNCMASSELNQSSRTINRLMRKRKATHKPSINMSEARTNLNKSPIDSNKADTYNTIHPPPLDLLSNKDERHAIITRSKSTSTLSSLSGYSQSPPNRDSLQCKEENKTYKKPRRADSIDLSTPPRVTRRLNIPSSISKRQELRLASERLLQAKDGVWLFGSEKKKRPRRMTRSKVSALVRDDKTKSQVLKKRKESSHQTPARRCSANASASSPVLTSMTTVPPDQSLKRTQSGRISKFWLVLSSFFRTETNN